MMSKFISAKQSKLQPDPGSSRLPSGHTIDSSLPTGMLDPLLQSIHPHQLSPMREARNTTEDPLKECAKEVKLGNPSQNDDVLTQSAISSNTYPLLSSTIPWFSTVNDTISNERISVAWTTDDDNRLMQLRTQGMNWAPIAANFPGKTPNSCRKRHERLMEKKSAESWDDGIGIEDLSVAYLVHREKMWRPFAEKLGEKWQTVEAKCMEKGLKTLTTAGRAARRNILNDPDSMAQKQHNPVSWLTDVQYSGTEVSSSDCITWSDQQNARSGTPNTEFTNVSKRGAGYYNRAASQSLATSLIPPVTGEDRTTQAPSRDEVVAASMTFSRYVSSKLTSSIDLERSHTELVEILSTVLRLTSLTEVRQTASGAFNQFAYLCQSNHRLIAETIAHEILQQRRLVRSIAAVPVEADSAYVPNRTNNSAPKSAQLPIGLQQGQNSSTKTFSRAIRKGDSGAFDYDEGAQWFVQTCKRRLMNPCATHGTFLGIENELLTLYIDTKDTSQPGLFDVYPSTVTILLHLSWDLNLFIDHQRNRFLGLKSAAQLPTMAEIMHRATTLIGTSTDAEAVSASEYLDRIWPQRGAKVLEFVQATNRDQPATYDPSIPGIIEIKLAYIGPELLIPMSGDICSVIEVVQILVWLSAVFRPGPADSEPSTCAPSIHRVAAKYPGATYQAAFRVEYETESIKAAESGQCWHSMFRNPVVVTGFPMAYRAAVNSKSGLEVSLPVIASLLQTNQVAVLDGDSYLKGFSSMLVPTRLESNFIWWHYIFDASGSYLPFSAAASCATVAIDGCDLNEFRHIVGWCSNARVNVGAPHCNYDIGRAQLPKTNDSVLFKSFSLSGGQFVSVGASVMFNVPDPPAHVNPTGRGIMDKLLWMEKRFIVLWDSKDKRGWLVDGVSALLHMLRASLRASEQSRFFKTAFRTRESDICEPAESYPQAAFDFFTIENYKNLGLELYLQKVEVANERTMENNQGTTKTTFTWATMQQRVEQIWEILAHIITTQQVEPSKRESCYIKQEFRQTLEGWDFVNLSCEHSPFQPIMTKMDCFSEPWIHFIRSINAVVLFGEGFGELIEPATGNNLCSKWMALPKEQNYLAATTSTLELIQKRHGILDTSPKELSPGFLWHNPNETIAPCTCTTTSDRKHTDAIQVIWPSSLRGKLCVSYSSTKLSPTAAVVFGQNERYRWWQDVVGRCVQGIPPTRHNLRSKKTNTTAKRKELPIDDCSIAISAPDSESSTSTSQASTLATEASIITPSTGSAKRRKLTLFRTKPES